MPEQVRVVPLLPDEHEMDGGHEVGDVGTPGRRAGERVGADAEPPGVVVDALVDPELLLLEELGAFGDQGAAFRPFRFHGRQA